LKQKTKNESFWFFYYSSVPTSSTSADSVVQVGSAISFAFIKLALTIMSSSPLIFVRMTH